jgi:hypothetical protein
VANGLATHSHWRDTMKIKTAIIVITGFLVVFASVATHKVGK